MAGTQPHKVLTDLTETALEKGGSKKAGPREVGVEDVPTLSQLQRYKKTNKKQKLSKIVVETLHEFRVVCASRSLPEHITAMVPTKCYAIVDFGYDMFPGRFSLLLAPDY